jgi:hypothetical protein
MIVMPYNARPSEAWFSRLRLEAWPSTWVRREFPESHEERREAIGRAAAGFLAGGPVEGVVEFTAPGEIVPFVHYTAPDGTLVWADYRDDAILLALPGQNFRVVASRCDEGWRAAKGIPPGVVEARAPLSLFPNLLFFRAYRKIMAIRCGNSFLWPGSAEDSPFAGPMPGPATAPPEVARAKFLSCLRVAASQAAIRAGTDEVALWAALKWLCELQVALSHRPPSPLGFVAILRGDLPRRAWLRLDRRLGFSRLLGRANRIIAIGLSTSAALMPAEVTATMLDLQAVHVSQGE